MSDAAPRHCGRTAALALLLLAAAARPQSRDAERPVVEGRWAAAPGPDPARLLRLAGRAAAEKPDGHAYAFANRVVRGLAGIQLCRHVAMTDAQSQPYCAWMAEGFGGLESAYRLGDNTATLQQVAEAAQAAAASKSNYTTALALLFWEHAAADPDPHTASTRPVTGPQRRAPVSPRHTRRDWSAPLACSWLLTSSPSPGTVRLSGPAAYGPTRASAGREPQT